VFGITPLVFPFEPGKMLYDDLLEYLKDFLDESEIFMDYMPSHSYRGFHVDVGPLEMVDLGYFLLFPSTRLMVYNRGKECWFGTNMT
jgi:hypothetical protein